MAHGVNTLWIFHLTLRTTGTTKDVTYRVRQYNTITVNRDRGVARLDYGCSFNPETGELVRADEDNIDRIQWGYWSSFPLGITGDPGELNSNDGEETGQLAHKYAVDNGKLPNFTGSAIGKLWTEAVNIDKGSSYHWYLPAHQEMAAITNHMLNRPLTNECLEVFNMRLGDSYWYARCPDAGDAYHGTIYDAFYITIGDDNWDDTDNKREFYRARPIRKFETE